MLRKIAIAYLIFESVYFSFKIYGAIANDLWFGAMFWISWSINFLGLLAVAGFAFKRQILLPAYWVIILVAYVGLRVNELVPNGLFISEWPIQLKVLIGAQYLLFILPSVFAMLHLAFFTKHTS